MRSPVMFALLVGLLTGSSLPAASTDKPNILWIGVDQMRADTPACNGNTICKTPNLDRLAREGVNFTRAYTTCCLCSPARASMFTGRYAFNHGMGTNCDLYHAMARELPQPEMLLHSRLQEMGYHCGFVGKWHVGTEISAVDYGFEGMDLPGYGDIKRYPGFIKYLENAGLSYGTVEKPIFGNPKQKTLLAGRWNGSVESSPTHYVANSALDLMDKYAADDQPFFINCQFWAPHPPYLPAGKYVGMYDRKLLKPWINFEDDYANKPACISRFRSGFYRSLPDTWDGWRELVGLYYDYTTMVDEQIGRLLDHLDKLGLAENTIVVFESDHGDMNGSHGGLFDKGFMYEEAFRIPMIMRWPGRFKAGQPSEALVYNMDIFPTLLDIVGKADPSLDGISLKNHLEGKDFPSQREAIYLEFHGLRCLFSQRAIVTKDGYKYIFSPGDMDELYDLNRDPGELNNLIDSKDHADLIEKVRQQLKIVSHQVKDPMADYISKLFGDWETLSGQFEAAEFIQGQKKN